MANTNARLTIEVDTSVLDKTLQEYMKYTNRDFAEACNQHAYYIARNAVNLTHATTRGKIHSEFEASSKQYPEAPLGAILVQSIRSAKGEPGLNGAAMRREVNRLIKKRANTINFLRAGWIPAIKALERLVPKKGGKPLHGTKMKGKPKGGSRAAIPSIMNWTPFAEIWNSISEVGPKAKDMIEKGAAMAVAQEIASMRKYIERKIAERNKQFWGG